MEMQNKNIQQLCFQFLGLAALAYVTRKAVNDNFSCVSVPMGKISHDGASDCSEVERSIKKRKAMRCPDSSHRGADPENAPCSGGCCPLKTPVEGGDQ